MTTDTIDIRRQQMDETAVKVVRALMSWHAMQMPEVADLIGQSIGTVERRLSRNPAIRKSWQGWELQLLAEAFDIDVASFYTGQIDLAASARPPFRGTTDQYSPLYLLAA